MASYQGEKKELDPLYLNARREAWWILLAWAVCLVWTVGYCALFGYEIDVATMNLVLGMPSWVFWGVFIPWMTATGFSIWFGLAYMRDDVLPEKRD